MKAHVRTIRSNHSPDPQRTRGGRRTRQFGAVVALTGLLLGTAACGDDANDEGTPAASAASNAEATDSDTADKGKAPEGGNEQNAAGANTQNAAAPNPAEGEGATGGDAGAGADGGNQDCSVQPNSPEITNNISKLPPNQFGWKPTGKSNYNPCNDLSYALITQEQQGNSQFATQLMLFHKGQYIGVGSDTTQQAEVLSDTDSSVTVRMRDWEALQESGDANVNADKYYSDVTFRWDGSKVVPEGRIPNQGLSK
ncbi:LppP/LprE family lipoprotein [uncultured Corynebacterium sp.]|uniref:LppP/LprE family lipoprotein n=1 Tax=uncultured Corynebacterium sp. TaxID=159447 RepID=UPI0025D79F47|nr:LppP/LprE family lipoprotein [uncultured Corynebacterium sp.]